MSNTLQKKKQNHFFFFSLFQTKIKSKIKTSMKIGFCNQLESLQVKEKLQETSRRSINCNFHGISCRLIFRRSQTKRNEQKGINE